MVRSNLPGENWSKAICKSGGECRRWPGGGGVHRNRLILFSLSETWNHSNAKVLGILGDFPSRWQRNFTQSPFRLPVTVLFLHQNLWRSHPQSSHCFMLLALKKRWELCPLYLQIWSYNPGICPRQHFCSHLCCFHLCRGKHISTCGYSKVTICSLTNQISCNQRCLSLELFNKATK